MASDPLVSAVAGLAGHLDEIARFVRFEPAILTLRVERVSRWSIGQHVDHSLKVLEAGQRFLVQSETPLARGINLAGRLALATGWLPRGVGKSPKGVLPADDVPSDLAERASQARRTFCEKALPLAILANPRPVFLHPYFGGLSALQGVRFLGIHTGHHMKIVADIRRAH